MNSLVLITALSATTGLFGGGKHCGGGMVRHGGCHGQRVAVATVGCYTYAPTPCSGYGYAAPAPHAMMAPMAPGQPMPMPTPSAPTKATPTTVPPAPTAPPAASYYVPSTTVPVFAAGGYR